MDGRHHLVEPILRLDQLAGTAAPLGQPSQERFVHGAVDAEREDANPLESACRAS